MHSSPKETSGSASRGARVRGVLHVAALALMLTGCSTTRPAAVGTIDRFPNHTVSEISSFLDSAVADTLTSLRAEALLSIRSPFYSGTATARIAHRRGDSLRVALFGTALRIEAGRLLMTRDSVFFYNRLGNRLYYGPLSALTQRLPTAMLEGPVFERLLGVIAPPGHSMTLNADSAHFHYHLEDSAQHYIIVPGLWRTTSYTHREPAGDLIEALAFTEFEAAAGVYFPRRIVMRRPREATNISLHYSEMQLNPPTLSLSLGVAQDAERINMETLAPRR